MKRSSTIFLQFVIVLIGIAAVAIMIRIPRLDGANAGATNFQIYVNSFVIFAYTASTAFFVGLYQAFKLLGYVGKNKVFTPESVKAFRIIKYCALIHIAFVALSFIFMFGGDPEDRPPGLFLRILVTFPAIVAAAAAAIVERILQNAVDLKSENDLTV